MEHHFPFMEMTSNEQKMLYFSQLNNFLEKERKRTSRPIFLNVDKKQNR